MILRLGWSRDVEEVERAGEGLVGDVVGAGGDAGVVVVAGGVDREVVQGGRVLGAVAGADLGGVLAEGGVADEVESVLGGPLRTGQLSDPLR
ncbi:hypothetical protein [Streptacidiphilus rugosus]|uniref:hypothetical protein n=1 Tax=Streptacidiphilus rugosus TaxID=405783 RepID=UPI0012F82BC4|nr:hypothetical protein [Streptacidiphilus rugosus]